MAPTHHPRSTNGSMNGNGLHKPRDEKEGMTPLCASCAALCCRYLALPIDNPETVEDYDNVRWYLMHENIHVFVESDQWHIGIATKCKHLQPDNRCGVYEIRPRICRGYTTDNCDYHGGEYDYQHLFTSAEQLRAFAEEELGKSMIFKERPRRPRVQSLPGGRKRVTLPVR